ncbi:MAG: GNAT family N-acetyltransferase [Cyanobacteria bacterium J06632_3]
MMANTLRRLSVGSTSLFGSAGLLRSRYEIASRSLAAAFVQDPFMSYVIPCDKTREQKLARLFAAVLRCCDRYGGIAVSQKGEGAITWISGKHFPLSVLSQIQSGLIWTPITLGFSAFDRLLAHDAYCEHQVADRAPEGFAYLWVLGVRPSARGRGLAKKLVLSALNQMKEAGHSVCWLRTDSEKNLLFYEHLGFTQMHAEVAPNSELPYWLFAKDLL